MKPRPFDRLLKGTTGTVSGCWLRRCGALRTKSPTPPRLDRHPAALSSVDGQPVRLSPPPCRAPAQTARTTAISFSERYTTRRFRVMMATSEDWALHERHFFAERLAPAVLTCRGDQDQAMALYGWDAAISAVLWVPLGHIEVALRNALDRQMTRRERRLGGSRHWLEDDSGQLGRDRFGPGRHAPPFLDIAGANQRVRANWPEPSRTLLAAHPRRFGIEWPGCGCCGIGSATITGSGSWTCRADTRTSSLWLDTSTQTCAIGLTLTRPCGPCRRCNVDDPARVERWPARACWPDPARAVHVTGAALPWPGEIVNPRVIGERFAPNSRRGRGSATLGRSQ